MATLIDLLHLIPAFLPKAYDRVYAAKGEKLWLEPYDYSEDGSKRLKRELDTQGTLDGVSGGAGLWWDLAKIIGERGFLRLFQVWQETDIDPLDPSNALGVAAAKAFPEKRSEIEEWWKRAVPVFVNKRERSAYKAETIDVARLSGKLLTLAGDDDSADGKLSLAGSGHAKLYNTPEDGEWYLFSLSVHGARYGQETTNAKFEIALCDKEMRPIAIWEKPLSLFKNGDSSWVKVELPPTKLPSQFYIYLNFRSTGSLGVFLSFDSKTKGRSQTTKLGKPGKPFSQGDWMIRVDVDRPKADG